MEDKQDYKPAELHTEYLNAMKGKKASKKDAMHSPEGSYIIKCPDIEDQWSSRQDLTLDIHQAKKSGIFEACFNFSAMEGIMVISTDEDALECYCSQLDREAKADNQYGKQSFDDSDDEAESEDDDEGNGEEESEDDGDQEEELVETKPATGSKRRADPPRPRGRPPKKSKIETENETIVAEPEVPRGRGRPPEKLKTEIETEKPTDKSPRGRGRPPKTPKTEIGTAVKVRGRGRPPKAEPIVASASSVQASRGRLPRVRNLSTGNIPYQIEVS